MADWRHCLSDFWRTVLIEDSLNGQHAAMLGFMLTLAEHLNGRVATSSAKDLRHLHPVRR